MARKEASNNAEVTIDKVSLEKALAQSLREQASQDYHLGHIDAAIAKLNELLISNCATYSDRDFLVLCLYSAGKYKQMVALLKAIALDRPTDIDASVNLALGLLKVNQHDRSVDVLMSLLETAEKESDTDVLIKIYEGLCLGSVKKGEYEQATLYARRSIMTKDAAVTEKNKGSEISVKLSLEDFTTPAFDAGRPDRNVIAYSLWGDASLYCQNAIENARLAPILFPEWTCRFYCDSSVPVKVVNELLKYGSDVVRMPDQQSLYEGLFWRFQVANDASVDRFLIRDADSLLSLREREAVLDWVDSGKPFHMMRDFYTHTALVMAGMWGGCSGLLPNLNKRSLSYLNAKGRDRTIDQRFLENEVWPYLKDNILIHDDLIGCFASEPFPFDGFKLGEKHVGQTHVPKENKGTLVRRVTLRYFKNK